MNASPPFVHPHYQPICKLGQGGMGEVYLAQQLHPVKRKVALKLLARGWHQPDLTARFQREIEALAALKHPNIAMLYDVGETDDRRPFFTMEYIEGADLLNYCNREQLPLLSRLKMFAKLCDAVQTAHEQGIIHRDLKPSNLMVMVGPGFAVPKVIDFGIAKVIQARDPDFEDFTGTGILMGSPGYMCPEQLRSPRLIRDGRVDVYALGVCLYELISGDLPFPHLRGGSAHPLAQLHLLENTLPPTPSSGVADSVDQARLQVPDEETVSTWCATLRSGLDSICLKALHPDPEHRYKEVRELKEDVNRFVAGGYVRVRLAPTASRKAKRRRSALRFVMAFNVVVGLALLATFVSRCAA